MVPTVDLAAVRVSAVQVPAAELLAVVAAGVWRLEAKCRCRVDGLDVELAAVVVTGSTGRSR